MSSLVQLGRQIEALESATGELRRAKQTVDGRLAEAMEAQARTESELEAVAGDKAKLVRHSPVVFLFATRFIVCLCVCVLCVCVCGSDSGSGSGSGPGSGSGCVCLRAIHPHRRHA